MMPAMAKNPLFYAVPAILFAGAAAFAADGPQDSADLQRQLSDAQDKLFTALHSYSLQQDQLGQLKADADKSAAEKSALAAQLDSANATISGLRLQAAAATQVDALRSQLRQTQDELAALAAENAQLKTSMALSGPSPAGGNASPTRPGIAPHHASEGPAAGPAPARAAAPQEAPPAAGMPDNSAKPPAPRIHVVVEGDSLTKISKEYYGTASRYDEIVAANRDVIRDENLLVVGAKLKIP
jgi:nucleoid-associated protein YgaU